MEHRIEFNLTENDHVALVEHLGTRFKCSRRGRLEIYSLWFLGIVVIPASVIMYIMAESKADFIPPSVGLALFASGVVWIIWNRRSFARRFVRKALRTPDGKHMLGSQTVVVAPEEFHYRGSFGEVSLRWNAVAEIEVVERAIYFFVSADSAVIVPEHAFPNQDDYREFIHAAQRYHDPRDAPSRPCPKCGYDLRSVADLGCPECGWRREE